MNTETETTDTKTAQAEPDPAQQLLPGVVPAQQQLAERKSALDRQDIDLMGQSPFASLHAFTIGQRMAQVLASSSIVPNEYRQWIPRGNQFEENPAAVGNCFIALELANRLNISPLTVMQQVDVIHGRPALRGKLMIALVNGSRHFAHDLRFECNHLEGDDYGYRAWTTARDGTRLNGPWITWKLVKAEGWQAKKDSKWQSIPEMMFQYRAASWFASLHATHITLGLYESEEAREIDAEPAEPTRAQLLNAATEARPKEAMPRVDCESSSGEHGALQDQPQEEAAAPAKPRGNRRRVKSEDEQAPPAASPEPEPDPTPDTTATVAPEQESAPAQTSFNVE
ncbi:MAG TPA: hypothetical protein VGK41_01425 [Solirubrobacterales bacterium]